MATLIVTLPQDRPGPGTELDYVLTTDGQTIKRQGRAAASLLPALAGAGQEVVAVAPARALSWHRVQLPARLTAGVTRFQRQQSAQLRAALEGLLEDQLLDEPAALHFALEPGTGQTNGSWVAVCDRSWLREHLQALEQAQRPVARVVPEAAPLPADAPARLHVSAGPHQAQLVLSDAQGVTVLPLGPGAAQWLAWPEAAPLLAEAGVAGETEQIFKRPATLQSAAQRALEASRSDWNLAQFDLASAGQARFLRQLARGWNQLRHEPSWRAARWLLVGLLAVQLVGLNALAWQERSLLEHKRQTIRDTLRQTFPDVPVVLDAPLQMERELSALQQATGAVSRRDLEAMLMALVSSAAPGQSLSEIEYSPGEARLAGLQLSADESANLDTRLRALGYAMRRDGERWLLRLKEAP